MSKDDSKIGGQPGASEQMTGDDAAQRRKRLAQLIGRLLARTWLQRRREAATSATSRNDSPAESLAT